MGWTIIESWIKGFAEFESICSFKVTPQIEDKSSLLKEQSCILQDFLRGTVIVSLDRLYMIA